MPIAYNQVLLSYHFVLVIVSSLGQSDHSAVPSLSSFPPLFKLTCMWVACATISSEHRQDHSQKVKWGELPFIRWCTLKVNFRQKGSFRLWANAQIWSTLLFVWRKTDGLYYFWEIYFRKESLGKKSTMSQLQIPMLDPPVCAPKISIWFLRLIWSVQTKAE